MYLYIYIYLYLFIYLFIYVYIFLAFICKSGAFPGSGSLPVYFVAAWHRHGLQMFSSQKMPRATVFCSLANRMFAKETILNFERLPIVSETEILSCLLCGDDYYYSYHHSLYQY